MRRYSGADLLTDWLFMALGDQVEVNSRSDGLTEVHI